MYVLGYVPIYPFSNGHGIHVQYLYYIDCYYYFSDAKYKLTSEHVAKKEADFPQ